MMNLWFIASWSSENFRKNFYTKNYSLVKISSSMIEKKE
jgi:hypothetical protein